MLFPTSCANWEVKMVVHPPPKGEVGGSIHLASRGFGLGSQIPQIRKYLKYQGTLLRNKTLATRKKQWAPTKMRRGICAFCRATAGRTGALRAADPPRRAPSPISRRFFVFLILWIDENRELPNMVDFLGVPLIPFG